MNPITNSTIKEQMRQRNESMAQNRESQIRNQLAANLNRLTYKKKYDFSPFGIGGGILGVILAFLGFGFSGIFVGLALGAGGWVVLNQSVNSANGNIDSEKQRLQDAANNEYGKSMQELTRELSRKFLRMSAMSKCMRKRFLLKQKALRQWWTMLLACSSE